MTVQEFLKSEGYNFPYYGTLAGLLDRYAAIKVTEAIKSPETIAEVVKAADPIQEVEIIPSNINISTDDEGE